MSKISKERQDWLRGAYLDCITEAAMHFAEGRTQFVDQEWKSFIAGEFEYLSELSPDDHAYLRDQAGLEAFRRIVVTQSAVHDAAVEKFRADNADVVNADARFALDTGWFGLLQHAADRVCTYPKNWRAKIDGGKEKFGCLVLHVDCDYSQRGCRSEVERLREEVRLRSLAACEICGEPGRLHLSGWAKTVCDRHVAVLGELREDDGKWADPWKWHEDGDQYPASSAALLRDLKPIRLRPKDHVVDLIPQTDIGRQIERDIFGRLGRQQDLLSEFVGALETAVVAAMNVKDEDVDDWLRSEVDRWQSVQPLSDDDREFLRRYLRNLTIDEGVRRLRKQEGMKSLQRFFREVEALKAEADALGGRERKLLEAYAGDLADSARGAAVKEQYLDKYVRGEVDLWPDVLELSEEDRGWLRQWLRRMIDAEYERIRRKQSQK